jgi:hypothetical protein
MVESAAVEGYRDFVVSIISFRGMKGAAPLGVVVVLQRWKTNKNLPFACCLASSSAELRRKPADRPRG